MQIKAISKVKSSGEAEQLAIDWQEWASYQDLSYGELSEWQVFFIELAKKFPELKEEFEENAII